MKKMIRRHLKKNAVLVICMILFAGILTVHGIHAYLSTAETKTNIYTIGEISIQLTETSYPGNTSSSVQNLQPKQVVDKNPAILNTGSNDAIVLLKLYSPVEHDITAVNSNRQKVTLSSAEVFSFLNSSGDPGFNNDWIELSSLSGMDDSGDNYVYVFGYNRVAAPNSSTTPLFNKVRLINYVENSLDSQGKNIVVEAYGIQYSDLTNVDPSDGLNENELETVYSIFTNRYNW